VRSSGTGQGALEDAGPSPDLIILDLMLPDIDGLQVLRRLRARGAEVPVIILTARDDDIDVIVGLELGADDYVVKPFNPRELVARVRAVLRRRVEVLALAEQLAGLQADQLAGSAQAGLPWEDPSSLLRLDPAARRAWFGGQLLDLRPREFDLLAFLAQHAGRVLDRETLLESVWGIADFIDDRTVDVHIHRLRQKLSTAVPDVEPIQTERGIGYRWEL
jgi:DNA-binding response OmpR family regulator